MSSSEAVSTLASVSHLKHEIELSELQQAATQSCIHGLPSSGQPTQEEQADVCRVCHCVEPDQSGEAALKYFGISIPSHAIPQNPSRASTVDARETALPDSTQGDESGIDAHTRNGPCATPVDSLIDLGCACRSDLALAHYACALRWFASRGSVVCEICEAPALNVNILDWDKIVSVLKERNTQQAQSTVLDPREVNSAGPIDPSSNTNIRAELLDAASWFDPNSGTASNLPRNVSEQVVDIPDEGLLTAVSPATKWAVEGTGLLIATGLLTVTITWLLAPRVDKGVARKGLNILLGGLCAFSIVAFLRFGILPRIKYGPARYWAILVVFWFLVFGVWASTTRTSR